MNKVFGEIYKTVWEDIFPGFERPDIEKFRELYTKDIILPKKYTSAHGGETVYCSPEYGYKRFISSAELEKHRQMDDFMVEPKPIHSLADVLQEMKDLALFRGSRMLNSDIVEESDDIYSSSYIYGSTHLYSCQKMMFCNNDKTSEYLLASKGSGDSAFGMRIIDSGGVSHSFDVTWSGKCANSYFCHSSVDLRDCMFCFHLTSKQYCIANMQFTKDEYMKLKDVILREYFEQLLKPGAFVSQNQL